MITEELQNSSPTSSIVEIFINFFSFILLGINATALGVIFFQIINKYFPDLLSGTLYGFMGGFNVSSIHYSIASLIVAFPLYVWTMRFWFKSFEESQGKTESKLSKWLTYLILLVAAGFMVGDLISVIYNYLQGELTLRFFLKALTVFVIAGLVFGFYYFERKKRWRG